MQQLVAEARRRVKAGNVLQLSGTKTGLLFEFSPSRRHWLLTAIKFAGWKLQQPPLHRIPELPNEGDPAIRELGEDNDTARMANHFPKAFLALDFDLIDDDPNHPKTGCLTNPPETAPLNP